MILVRFGFLFSSCLSLVFLVHEVNCSDCPTECTCSYDGHVDCHHGNLTKVPDNLPVSTDILVLSGNRIKHIKKDDFTRYHNLHELYLDDNPIESIADGCFIALSELSKLTIPAPTSNVTARLLTGLYHLQHLEIQGMGGPSVRGGIQDEALGAFMSINLDYLAISGLAIRKVTKDMLKYIRHIETLNLSGNAIEYVEQEALTSKNIKFLDLTNNRLSGRLDLENLHTLSELSVSGNLLTDISARQFPELLELHARNNKLTQFTFTTESASWEVLDLSANLITNFTINQCGMLHHLSLSHNPLQHFSKRDNATSCMLGVLDLRNVTGLKELDLSLISSQAIDLSNNCHLETIKFSEHYEHTSLREITMKESCLQLSTIPPAFLRGGQIEKLDLHGNNITTVHGGQPLTIKTEISDLNLSRNHIQDILFDKQGVHFGMVDLSDNNIRSLNSTGNNIDVLSTLHLKRNRLTKLPVFHNVDVSYLDLSDNLIEELNVPFLGDHAQTYTTSLEEINLNNNLIKEVKVGVFVNLHVIHTLLMNNNSIETIEPDAFASIQTLEVLELAYNRLSTKINAVGSSHFFHLQHLVLKGNKITRLDKDFMDTVKHSNSEMHVDVSENPLQCECSFILEMRRAYITSFNTFLSGQCTSSNKTNSQEFQLEKITEEMTSAEIVKLFHCTTCGPNTCNGRGKCQEDKGGAHFKCVCQSGYIGSYCEKRSRSVCLHAGACGACNDTVCLNDGYCMETSTNSYVCHCASGFSGAQCEIEMDPCKTKSPPCPSPKQFCVKVDAYAYNCECTEGYKGDGCQQEYMHRCNSTSECNEHGDCIEYLATKQKRCLCDHGWQGDTCNIVTNTNTTANVNPPAPPKRGNRTTKKGAMSSSTIAVIVLAVLLVFAVAILVYIIRKYRIFYKRFDNNDDRLELSNDF